MFQTVTVCFRVTYLTQPRQAGLGSWFRSLPIGVLGPFALATGSLQCQWDGLRLPVLGPGPDSARAQDTKWSRALRAQ
jgi:hypothetical protein